MPTRRNEIVPRPTQRLASAGLLFLALACGNVGPLDVARNAPSTAFDAHEIDSAPFVLVLGTAQDGGIPHAGCHCPRCDAARDDGTRVRLIASLAVVLPEPRRVFVIDATPDIRRQLDMLRDPDRPQGTDRAPVDGILLTHAHIGHYLGLAFLGFEAIHSRGVPVHASAPLAEYLRNNGPWSQLVRLENVVLFETSPGRRIELGQGVSVTPLAVPHRDEYTDTSGFVVRGPRRTVLYVPDTDSWDAWDPPLTERLEAVDVAILDGTFYSVDELPGRDVSAIGHPLISDSIELLQPMLSERAVEVFFTHLNHSNPVLDDDGRILEQIEARGFGVLADGQRIPL